MCEAIGQEENYWFAADDFKNFPCPDLRIIDGLWVKYSQGKFGFSVPKKIWEACGSPINYNDDWEKFGQEVGWLVKENWVSRGLVTKTRFDRFGNQTSTFLKTQCRHGKNLNLVGAWSPRPDLIDLVTKPLHF